MAGLSRQHHDLATVMPFVCDEIGENVDNVDRQIHPRDA